MTEQIAAGEQELSYIDSVFDALSRAHSYRELSELREELAAGGYLRRSGSRQKPPPPTKPMEFVSDDGFLILVGRNNLQNDRLTTKTARGATFGCTPKTFPARMVIVVTEGRTPPIARWNKPRCWAALHSRAAQSRQVRWTTPPPNL